MSYQLADYQQNVVDGIYKAYREGARVVMPVLPTGAGKTVIMGSIAHQYNGYGCSMAHRSELVSQMSVALAREGLRHDIVAPDKVIRTIVAAHMREIGKNFYDARAPWKVASVDTIIKRELPKTWTRQVGMVHGDEGHHYLRDNKFGRALSIFDNAYGLLPTATAERADGRGLGSHADGLVDALVEGPGMRWLINNGHLTNYEVIAPVLADLDMTDVEISAATGDYNLDKMRKRVKGSNKIIGDIVKHYLLYARGLKGITFSVDVEHAELIAAAYNAAGVPAVVVHSKTSDSDRFSYMDRLQRGDLLQLVNVDLFGEGVDVPAVQVVSMARPTASYGLYVQQFGRALRLLLSPILRAAWHTYTAEQRLAFIAESAKPRALIIDHVGNIIHHRGPPDWRTTPWSLDSRDRRKPVTDGIPLRACGNNTCNKAFERFHPKCPYCDWEPPLPADRSRPDFVDGDLMLYTPELFKKLFGEAKAMDLDNQFVPIPYGVSQDSAIAGRLRNIHAANQSSQKLLRDTMSLVLPPTLDERVANRRFFHTYGVDTLTAKGLVSAEADQLRQRILAKVTGQ